MLSIVIIIIALGWVAFAASWARDRARALPGSSLMPDPYGAYRENALNAPRTEKAALVRRQQVLCALVVAAVLTFLMTRLWLVMWGLNLLVDVALVAFVAAWYLRSANQRSGAMGALVGSHRLRSSVETGRSWQLRGFNQPTLQHEVVVPVRPPVAQGWVNSA